MAHLCYCDSYLAVAACEDIFVVKLDLDEAELSTEAPRWPIVLSVMLPDEASSAKVENDDQGDGEQETAGKRMKQSQPNWSTSPQVLAAAFSTCGRLLAVCNNRKRLIVWQEENGNWSLTRHWTLEKQATALAISSANKSILVADRYGQVTEFKMENPSESRGIVLLGHVSILLDLCLSKSQKYLLTADRDEKIRISRYPKCYNIQAFCLGHTEYIRTLCLCPDLSQMDEALDVLASGGGDGKVRLWRYVDGLELVSIDCNESLNGSAVAAAGEAAPSNRIRKILCLEEPSTSGFRLIVSFEESPLLQFIDVSCTATGEYTMQKSHQWRLEHMDAAPITDMAVIGNRLIILASPSPSGPSILELDVSTIPPHASEPSTAVDCLNKCEQMVKSLAVAKEELPPVEKDVQYDNMGEYLARKKARIESKSKSKTET